VARRGGQTGPDGVPDGVARWGARRGQMGCPTGPDGVPDGGQMGWPDGVPDWWPDGVAKRGQTDAMSSATSFMIATSFLNAILPV
jgi:hypothetical protein